MDEFDSSIIIVTSPRDDTFVADHVSSAALYNWCGSLLGASVVNTDEDDTAVSWRGAMASMEWWWWCRSFRLCVLACVCSNNKAKGIRQRLIHTHKTSISDLHCDGGALWVRLNDIAIILNRYGNSFVWHQVVNVEAVLLFALSRQIFKLEARLSGSRNYR
jgi:hypothetical protein